jgi:hypothetical protein
MADDLNVMFARGNEVGFGRAQIRPRERKARIGLRNVGTGHVADFEAVGRRLEVDFQNLHVVAVETDDRGVERDVEIGGNDRGKDPLSVLRKLACPASTRVLAARTELRTPPPE